MAAKSAEIRGPLFFLCEGNADCSFVRVALRARRKTAGYDIRPTSHEDLLTGEWRFGGVDSIKGALRSFRSQTGFGRSVRHVVVVIDNDEDPVGNFARARRQIEEIATEIAPHLAVPTAPHTRATLAGGIDVTILTMPWMGRTGSLETLVLPALLAANHGIARCLGTYEACTGVARWTNEIKKDEMRVRCVLAAASEGNPDIGLGKVWSDAPALIPIDHPSLREIVDCLAAQSV